MNIFLINDDYWGYTILFIIEKKNSKKEKNSKEKFCNYNTYGKQKYTTQTLPYGQNIFIINSVYFCC